MAGWIDKALDALERTRLILRISLVLGAVVFLGGAVATVWTADTARLNQLGYSSICPFAPFSTVVLVVLAAGCVGGWFVLNKLLAWRERRAASRR